MPPYRHSEANASEIQNVRRHRPRAVASRPIPLVPRIVQLIVSVEQGTFALDKDFAGRVRLMPLQKAHTKTESPDEFYRVVCRGPCAAQIGVTRGSLQHQATPVLDVSLALICEACIHSVAERLLSPGAGQMDLVLAEVSLPRSRY